VWGQSVAMTGENSILGIRYSLGIRAAFTEANMNGGIYGRMLSLATLDDGYDPARTVNNTITFLANSTIFGLIGYGGTQQVANALPYILNSTLPFMGPRTGAMQFRQPFIKQVINLRASYDGMY
jgi:ABC-type branched-subunit amino acid transport system substrate-binding protein